MIPIPNTVKLACDSDKLVYKEYIILDGQHIEIKGKMSNTAYKDTTFFGTFNLKMLTFTTENDVDYKQKEFIYYKTINNEPFKIGTYIVTEVKDNDTNEEVTVVAYDYGLKFANTYETTLNYASNEITLYNVLEEVCNICNVALKDVSITNGDFIVDSNQFTEGTLYGDVISAIAMISGTFATINEDDELTFILRNETDEIIEDYVELLDKRDTQPINCVAIGNRDIEGENVVLKDQDSIDIYGENWLIIQDNPFAYNQDKRASLITALFDKVKGFTYSSFESDYAFKPYLQLGDSIKFRNKNGDLIDSLILKIETDYDDIKLSAPSIIKATIEYQNPLSALSLAKRTEIIVDKQEQKITSVVAETNENSNKITTLTQTVDGIDVNVSSLNTNVGNLTTKTNQLSIDVNQLRSEIGDVTDITTQEEGAGELNFENINSSEPINITIRPTANKDISYIYPRSNLFPSTTLFPQNRILRFYNSTTDETFDYTLPGNLRYYNETTYDEFFLDYSTLTCRIIRKVNINSSGVKSAKETPVIENYDYPTISLTAGNYTVTMMGYQNAYLKIRLMSQNMYTSQFATRVELSSAINQSATAINLEVAKKVGNDEVISRINQTAEAIKIEASKIDIQGTLTAINNDTTTTIDGNKITTGSITASKVAADIITTSNFSAQNINANKITAGTLNGATVNITNLNASNITGGTLSANRISGGSISASSITGSASINISRGVYYLRMGLATSNPSVSGLNVGGYGIKAYSGIVATGFGITDSDTGKSVSVQVARQGGGYYYMTFTGGILTSWERY